MDLTENAIGYFDMDRIPDVVLLEIFAKFNFTDLCNCSQVCRRWYRLSHSLSLRRKISIAKYLKPRQFSQLVQHHFHKGLEEFEFLHEGLSPMVPLKKQTFFKLQAKCPGLKKLVLMWCCLANVTLEDMPTSLRYLSVRNSEINPYNFFTARPQHFVPHLTCLDVGGVSNFLTSEDLHIFTHLKSLRCLYLEGCFRINNGGIESIVDIIRQLEVLDVEGTDISNEGVRIIITNGSMLKELFLGCVNVDDDVFHEMYMDMFLRLQTLCVRFTNITLLVVEKFLRARKINFISNYDPRRNFNDLENAALNRFAGCSHFLSHSCSY